MRRHSQMGASKYEFNPEQLDTDVERNQVRLEKKRKDIKKKIIAMLESDPVRIEESFSTLLDVLREVKISYKL